MDIRISTAQTQIHASAFIATNATVLGDVHVGKECSIWFGSVVRGDIEEIRIGAGTNIQDLSVLHADAGYPCLIGENVTVGHRCILHGCKIGDGALIGMGAIIMNGAEIGERCIVGAGALIPEGKIIPAGSLVIGAPGKVKRPLSEIEEQSLVMSAAHYVENGQAFKAAGHGQNVGAKAKP